eukprot:TRINITY_DN16681_c0_g1_i1.p1 TRINITY_DN16681_c0_g1~~TRINITY_DN16681_c0_g1_i1.p1  ORF type:complete len:157 (-),score=9.28 TRINITY_DN16681_c0_g1_i1:585-1055(-)
MRCSTSPSCGQGTSLQLSPGPVCVVTEPTKLDHLFSNNTQLAAQLAPGSCGTCSLNLRDPPLSFLSSRGLSPAGRYHRWSSARCFLRARRASSCSRACSSCFSRCLAALRRAASSCSALRRWALACLRVFRGCTRGCFSLASSSSVDSWCLLFFLV